MLPQDTRRCTAVRWAAASAIAIALVIAGVVRHATLPHDPPPPAPVIEYRTPIPAPVHTPVIVTYAVALPPASATPAPAPSTPTATSEIEPPASPSLGPSATMPMAVAAGAATPVPIVAVTPAAGASLTDTLVAGGWPAALASQAEAVATCESHGHPTDVSSAGALGLFQLMPAWFSYFDVPLSEWRNPVANAHVAWLVYQYDIGRGESGWAAWICQP